jgi:predicted secreted Zn-dependent protease
MKIENKKTAVEWLFEQLTEVDYKCINKTFLQNNNSLAGFKLRELCEQAKKMEKQQIIDAYDKAQYDYDLMRETDSEQYYNETFKSE